jgi:hypothetical protein
MLIEVAKPVAFVLCILSLYAVFHAAFLNPANDLEERVYESLHFLGVAAGVSVAGAMVFRQGMQEACARKARLAAMLPMRMFYWASGIMFVLFVVSLYLERHCIFYKDVRVF